MGLMGLLLNLLCNWLDFLGGGCVGISCWYSFKIVYIDTYGFAVTVFFRAPQKSMLGIAYLYLHVIKWHLKISVQLHVNFLLGNPQPLPVCIFVYVCEPLSNCIQSWKYPHSTIWSLLSCAHDAHRTGGNMSHRPTRPTLTHQNVEVELCFWQLQ